MTVSEVKTFLALSGVTLDVDAGMKTFADAGERALAVPDFTGQLGTQRDTNLVYISTGTTAGDWGLFSLALAMLASGFFTADSDGRGKFANGFINAALLASDAVETAKILDLNVTAGKLAAALDLSGKTLTMPANHWRDIAPVGSVLQVVQAAYTTNGLITTPYIPSDDTIPQITEGTQILARSITPSSVSNKVLARFQGQAYMSNNAAYMSAMFRNSDADAISARQLYSGAAVNQQYCQFVIEHLDSPASIASQTYTIRVSPSATGNMYLNGAASRLLGGVSSATLTLMEIKG